MRIGNGISARFCCGRGGGAGFFASEHAATTTITTSALRRIERIVARCTPRGVSVTCAIQGVVGAAGAGAAGVAGAGVAGAGAGAGAAAEPAAGAGVGAAFGAGAGVGVFGAAGAGVAFGEGCAAVAAAAEPPAGVDGVRDDEAEPVAGGADGAVAGADGAAAEPAEPVAGGVATGPGAGVPAEPIPVAGSPIVAPVGSGIGRPIAEPSAEPAAAEPAEPEPVIESRSAFSFASSFWRARSDSSEPNFSSASDESLDAMNARTIDVAMKMIAAAAVSLRRNVEAPEPPKTVAALPPPKAPPMPPPLPDCKSTVSIRNSDTMTCRMVTSVDMREARLVAQRSRRCKLSTWAGCLHDRNKISSFQ